MIYSVTGKLTYTGTDFAVINCGGVGYSCKTSLNTLSKISGKAEDITLFTHLVVRENDIELYGFATIEELNCFKLVITVSGVGAKAGISILSALSVQSFARAVAENNPKPITSAKGIGLKTAQRIILELKDKLKTEDYSDFSDLETTNVGQDFEEAVCALCVLGYSRNEAVKSLSKADMSLSVEELIKCGLKNLSKF